MERRSLSPNGANGVHAPVAAQAHAQTEPQAHAQADTQTEVRSTNGAHGSTSTNGAQTAAHNGAVPHTLPHNEFALPAAPHGTVHKPHPVVDPTSTPDMLPQRTTPHELREVHRARSLGMQLRFLRSLSWALWLFVRILFWYQVVERIVGKAFVDRGNLRRWTQYAREFRGLAVSMGGVMIKLGQFASTRADILPEEIINELKSLQDEVPTIKFSKIRRVLEAELGSLDERFAWLNETPVAAASLGQVHRARLHNGDRVVVKVQRPGIRQVVYTDLAALRVVAWVASKFRFISRRADAPALAREFARVLLEEISYVQEARNAIRFAEMFKNDMGVYVPTVYTEHSTDCVLTLEDVTTIKLTDFEALDAAGINRKTVARRLMDTYLEQIFEKRFFHADPHPGNLFIYPLPIEDGKDPQRDFGKQGRPFYLIFIDFGMTGTLTRQITDGLVDTLAAVINRDARALVQSYKNLGIILPGADMERIEDATIAVFDQVWGLSMTEIKNVDYNEVAALGAEFSDLLFDMPFQVPQDFIYLGRAVGILSGMCTHLDPEYNPWTELLPYAQQLAAQSIGFSGVQFDGRGGTGRQILQSIMNGNGGQAIMQLADTFNRVANPLTRRADEVIEQIERGDLKFTVKPNTLLKKKLDAIEANGRRANRMIFFGSVLITSTLLYTSGSLELAGAGYFICAATLVWGWLRR